MNRVLSVHTVSALLAFLAGAACSSAGDDAARPTAAGAAEAPAAAPAAARSSPRDSASASIGNATVLVDYGRPSRRGREIFGGLVPYGAVWRTGANAATTLVLGGDVELGGRPLKAGTYTLYSLPARDGWTLIVSGQTGQWGTEYNAGRDVMRVPLETSRAPTPVDTFTISAEGGEGEGRLVFAWDTLQGAVALRAR
jgi:hypothetical protein